MTIRFAWDGARGEGGILKITIDVDMFNEISKVKFIELVRLIACWMKMALDHMKH